MDRKITHRGLTEALPNLPKAPWFILEYTVWERTVFPVLPWSCNTPRLRFLFAYFKTHLNLRGSSGACKSSFYISLGLLKKSSLSIAAFPPLKYVITEALLPSPIGSALAGGESGLERGKSLRGATHAAPLCYQNPTTPTHHTRSARKARRKEEENSGRHSL